MLHTAENLSSTALVKIAIPSVDVLSACYMPFLKRKGLFVPSTQLRELGEQVFLVLRLEPAQVFAAGAAQVCWITPPQSSDGRVGGFGLHFDADNSELAEAIEACLALNNYSIRPRTHTL
jgi:type IV pilus assembly protein PilZ